MPGRKSNVSTTSVGPDEAADTTPARQTNGKEREGLSVEDLSLPKSMIARLSKGVLPPNTQIHKDALLALHKSATVFVSYIASNSNDNAQASGKKTISPHDVMAALKDAELPHFLPRLEAELKKYNDTQCDKRNTYRRKVKEEKAAAAAAEGEGDATEATKNGGSTNGDVSNGAPNGHAMEVEDAERPMKKLKTENGDAVPPDAEDDDAEDEADADEHFEDADEEIPDDEIDEEDDDDDGAQDETMEDALEEVDARSEASRDSAIDDPDSD